MNNVKGSSDQPSRGFLLVAGILLVILCAIFARSFTPNEIIFANDGPLGVNISKAVSLPYSFTGWWGDLNWLGSEIPSPTPNFSGMVRLILGPYYYAKFFAIACQFVLGLSAWLFFRQLKFHRAVCVMGGIAAALNGNFLSNMAWGQGSRPLSLAATFLALTALHSAPTGRKWIKIVLAGFCVGLGVTEGFDVGAIFSLYISVFVLFFAWIQEARGGKGLAKGMVWLGVIAVCAGVIATQTVNGLISTQIKGIFGMDQTKEAKEQRWNEATQWSTPKLETLRVIIPGIFGYRMTNREGHIYDGSYWGRVGQAVGVPTSRFCGSGEYAGVLVALLSIYAICAAFKKNAPFSPMEKKLIIFWGIMGLGSLLLAFGRYAPFYRFVYEIPYASTIRNPMKFMHPFHMIILILFGYGLQGLYREYIEKNMAKTDSITGQIKKWWRTATAFEKKWTLATITLLAVSMLGWLIYAGSQRDLQKFLQAAGFDGPQSILIASFSAKEVFWFVALFLGAVFLVMAVMSGWFSGQRAKWASLFLGLLLTVDLMRASPPWIVYWDAKQKYESNAILDILRDKPYEHRVNLFPARLGNLSQLYSIEWHQQLFQYYNIQSLDVVQESRPTSDTMAYRSSFNSAPKMVRQWELTNVRYFLGANGDFVQMANQQLDPEKKRFKVVEGFDIGLKSGISSFSKLEDLTATINPKGEYALIEFTGALPRAKLYSHWQIKTNEDEVLQQLGELQFDPSAAVLVSSEAGIPAAAENAPADAGTVEFVSYAPKKVVLQADVKAAAVLLHNDKLAANWYATVDGQPAKMFRANYLMRGLYLQPGKHTITFAYEPSRVGLYVSIVSMCVSLLLAGVLLLSKKNEAQSNPAPSV